MSQSSASRFIGTEMGSDPSLHELSWKGMGTQKKAMTDLPLSPLRKAIHHIDRSEAGQASLPERLKRLLGTN